MSVEFTKQGIEHVNIKWVQKDEHVISFIGLANLIKIPSSGLCWITSFLIGVYLSLVEPVQKITFREIICGLVDDQEFVQWIIDDVFVQKAFNWDLGPTSADTPLYTLINSLKKAILVNADSLETEVAKDYGSIAVPEDGWKSEFEENISRYGSFFSLRVLQKFFTQKGLNTNVVIFAKSTNRSFLDAGFKNCPHFDWKCPTITIYYTGNHFDLLTGLTDYVISHYSDPYSVPQTLGSIEDSSENSMVEDLLRQLEEANRRATEAECRASEAECRASEAEQRILQVTSHADQAERVVRETLEQIQILISENQELKRRVEEADEAYARSLT